MHAPIEQILSQIYLVFCINSFIVFMDQLIELSKSKEFKKSNLQDIELNAQEIKNVSSAGISLLILLTEVTILVYLKSVLIFCIISIVILFTIFIFEHSKIKKKQKFLK